ncbi:MAG: hypothetical protein B7X06_02395 [Verrucomicrobia bacterium 21-51-4]|nr:MAG: hypothetical protein B7X06_02395 [Verrucomicrobia bacterium 21-51-4]
MEVDDLGSKLSNGTGGHRGLDRLILETLKSAIANAENNHNLSSDTLIVRKAVVETGPVLKRFQPVPRGQAFPIRKRQSHIRIWLEPKQSAKK